ncbi:MAG: hypothetical protein ACFFBP_07470 [Promethearchaeota archaeon]
MKKIRFRITVAIVILLLIIPITWQGFSSYLPLMLNKNIDHNSMRTSAIVYSGSAQWLKDTGFDYPTGNWTEVIGGDPSDVSTSIGGVANYSIEGEIKTFSGISGIPQNSDWTRTTNPKYPALPDTATIDDNLGCYVSHEWHEGSNQSPSVHWERNVSITEDMSNYIITSASLNVLVNATVEAFPNWVNPGDTPAGIEAISDAPSADNYSTGDYIRFYLLISDLSKNKQYELAWNRTYEDLGSGTATWDYMSDTYLTTISEQKMIDYLTSVLRTDNHNFTITLGIRIRCEDNFYYDDDNFEDIYIKSCDFSFTYVKKIDRLTTVSWKQDCDKISDLSDYFELVTNATLTFSYKIDQTWPTNSSPNAEIRALINNNPHSETIKLSNLNTTFQSVKKEIGFKVTSLIPIIENISLSIQVYLRDEFGLNRTITISIDNVSLVIDYDFIEIETIPPILETLLWLVILLIIALAAIGSYFIAYQTYLKYPKLVRRIRSLRRNLRKGKRVKNPITVNSRQNIVNDRLKNQMKTLRIEPELERAGTVVKSSDIQMKGSRINNSLKGGK